MTHVWLVALALAGGNYAGGDYAPSGGNFRIHFPGDPKESKQSPKSDLGPVEVHTATYATSDGNVYMVSYSDLPEAATKPENLDTLFKGVIDGAKGGRDVKVTMEAEQFGKRKLPARQLEFDRNKQHVVLWVVVSGNRLYQLAVVGTPKFCKSSDAADFLKSFEITK